MSLTGNKPDIDFVCDNGARYKLKWHKGEYRAHKYMHGGWFDTHLGSTYPDKKHDNLIDYIKRMEDEKDG